MLDIFPRVRRPILAVHDAFCGGGAMAERMRAFDWGRTSLGTPESWPVALVMAVRTLLASPQPQCLWWGEDRVTFLNDACVPLLGGAHATGLGMPASAAWRELWPEVAGRVERAIDHHQGFITEPLALSIDRDGAAFEAHFRIAGTPVGEDAGSVEGVLCAFIEATVEVLAAREQRVLGVLASRLRTVRAGEDVALAAIAALATDAEDFPFAALYAIDAANGTATLAAQTGIAPGHALCPVAIAAASIGPWPLREALAAGEARFVALPEKAFGSIPAGPWCRPPLRAAVIPIAADMVLVAALNPFRAFDSDHCRFIDVLGGQMAALFACRPKRQSGVLLDDESLYRAVGESIRYGVWTADAQGRTTYASEPFLQLLGLTLAQWQEGWRDVVHPDDVPALLECWSHSLRTGQQLDKEYRVRCADGEYRMLLGRGAPVHDERGGIAAWAGIYLDVGRMKRAEDELREIDRRKDEFIATLAHELRNPLAPLRNGLEVMRLTRGNGDMADKARTMMERQLAQMVRLVDDLLDVSRVSRGRIELRREPVELAAVLRNAVETSQPLMAHRGHELVVAIPPQSIVVDVDGTRLSQVFWNLLNNAAKYTEPGGRIELAVSAGADKVTVSIRDNGIGIPPEMQARVFDIFTQVDRSLEKSQGGLGIGLSIAKRLVEMHGGTIRVRSDGHKRGSEFVVTLPALVTSRPHDSLDATGAHPRLGGPSRRVLIADDNRDSAATLSLMLEALGNEVRVAHDGEEAFAAAAEFHPDVILLDIGMPKLNGYGACQMIRAQPWGREPRIVALTGWAQEEDKQRARAAGFDRHVVKPVEPAILEELIRAVA